MRHLWTKEEEKFLIDNVRGISLKKLTEIFNKEFNTNLNEKSVLNKKTKLNLKSGIYGGRFEKGFVSKRRKELGHEIIDKNGNILIKTQNRKGNKNYISKQRYIYEQKYGKVPKGYKIIFADKDKRNFDLNNLILISNAECLIMNREGLIKTNTELTKTGLKIAKIIDRINKTNKKMEDK